MSCITATRPNRPWAWCLTEGSDFLYLTIRDNGSKTVDTSDELNGIVVDCLILGNNPTYLDLFFGDKTKLGNLPYAICSCLLYTSRCV